MGPLPYLWVPELHADGERYHVHFVVGRYTRRSLIVDAWPHGFVHIKLIGDLPTGSGTLGEARIASRYLAKYVVKGLDAGEAGLHRYEVGEGFQPPWQWISCRTLGDGLAKASEEMGAEPQEVWDSATLEGWTRPHAMRALWARRPWTR